MGDEDDRVAGREAADHREQALRAGRVQACGRLVQDQYRRVPQEGPGQADPLALAAGQQAAALAHRRVVAIGQRRDERVRVRRPGRGGYLILRGPGPAVPDVVRHRAREEQRLLGQQGDVVPQGAQGQLAQVDPVEQDPSGIRVAEAQQQPGHGGLAAAAAAGAGHRQQPARRGGERQPVQHGLAAARVAERHGLDVDPAPAEQSPSQRRTLLGHRGPRPEDVTEPGRAGGCLRQAEHQPAQALDWRVQVGQAGREGQQPGQAKPPARHVPRAHREDEQHAARLEEVDQRLVQRVEPRLGHRGPQPGHPRPVQPLGLGVLPVERLDQYLVAQALLDRAGQRAAGGTFGVGGAPGRAGEAPGQQPEGRPRGEGDQGQIPPDDQRRRGERQDADRGGDQGDRPRRDRVLDHGHVVGEPDQQVAEPPLADVVGREPLGAGEYRVAQPQLDPPGGQPGQPLASRHGQRSGGRNGQPGAGQRPEARQVACFQHPADNGLEDDHSAELSPSQDQAEQAAAQEPEPVTPGAGPESGEQFGGAFPHARARARRPWPFRR